MDINGLQISTNWYKMFQLNSMSFEKSKSALDNSKINKQTNYIMILSKNNHKVTKTIMCGSHFYGSDDTSA